jgi:hypothetical protein
MLRFLHAPRMAMAAAPDYDRLEGYFRALGYSARLELLHLLKLPRAVNEIKLAARQEREGQRVGRTSSRQAILGHLEKLMEIGVVDAAEPEGPTGKRRFVVNGAKLYQIMEEFRQVGMVLPTPATGRHATVGLGDTRDAADVPGPKLLLAHGLHEGKAFPLKRADAKGDRGWVIGRKAGLHVSLDYDPFVSLENSEIKPEGGRYLLEDLPSSRNGTFVNWRRLDKGERVSLWPGAVIGVGRTLLVFSAE